jgi:glycosyltransferase involved in cell wall biosynthesis
VTPRILCFATQGTGSGDEHRIRRLLEPVSPTVWPFDRGRKLRSAWRLFRELVRTRPDLVVMEGTGIAGGVAVLAGRVAGVPYIVSSGDAVGPYLGSHKRALRGPALAYEYLLCRRSAGFIGWSPYLAGRALTFGAPRAMTAANWSELRTGPDARDAVRNELGIPADALVFGLVGSLAWNPRVGYCYGLELVRALRQVDRPDLRVLIVGDGDGREVLADAAGDELGERLVLPGRVPRDRVGDYLAAIDVASLPQSVDGVGSFRYTTKISEYLAAGLPVVTGQIPLAYDLDDGWLWRLHGDAPWDERYVAELSQLMDSVSPAEVARRRELAPRRPRIFDQARQQRQVTGFVADVLARA